MARDGSRPWEGLGGTISDGIDITMRGVREQLRLAEEALAWPWKPQAMVDGWVRSAEASWKTTRELTDLWLDRAERMIPGRCCGSSSSTGRSTAVRYIESNGDPQVSPPWSFEKVHIQGSALEASYTRLSDLCDRRLNAVVRAAGGDFTFKPIESLHGSSPVFVLMSAYPKFYSLDPVYREYGVFAQKELCYAVPVIKWVEDVPAELGLFLPYLFLDNDWSIITGREVLGLPKMLGSFHYPDSEPSGPAVKVYARIFEKYGRRARMTDGLVTQIQVGDGAPPRKKVPIDPFFGAYEELFTGDAPFVPDDDVRDFLHDRISRIAYSMLGLKQFRHAHQPELACTRCVVEAGVADLKIRRAKLLPPVAVEVPDYPHGSLRIAQELGLRASGGKDGYEARFPYEVECDFNMPIAGLVETPGD